MADPDAFYQHASRKLQNIFGSRRLADRIASRYVSDMISESHAALIELADCLWIASVDADNQPHCSYKGGQPGFVKVIDERTLAIPNYDGNGMYLTLGNILSTRKVGLLFIDYEKRVRLRVSGDAEIHLDKETLGTFPGSDSVVFVHVTDAFENCPRYLHDVHTRGRSADAPGAAATPPLPDWKHKSEYEGLLPAPAWRANPFR